MVQALAEAGVDSLLCETFPDAIEARVAVEEAVRTGLPTWVSLLPMGGMDVRLSGWTCACAEAGAAAVLVNCLAAEGRPAPVATAVGAGRSVRRLRERGRSR